MDSKLDKVREFATSEKAYRPPKGVNVKDSSDVQDLDEIKLHELKEVSDLYVIIKSFYIPSHSIQCFNLFDLNNDGYIDANDLKGTFRTMGMEVSEEMIQSMLKDASQPIDFDSFAMMMCFKTMELEVLLISSILFKS